jgi:hypothetical protein
MAIQDSWAKPELEQQFHLALFEHTILHPLKLSTVLREIHGDVARRVLTKKGDGR